MSLIEFEFNKTYTYSIFKQNVYSYNFVQKDFQTEDILDISFTASAVCRAKISIAMGPENFLKSFFDKEIVFDSFDGFLKEINSLITNERLKFSEEKLKEVLNPLRQMEFFV